MKHRLAVRYCKHCDMKGRLQVVVSITQLYEKDYYFYRLQCMECNKFNIFLLKEEFKIYEVYYEK